MNNTIKRCKACKGKGLLDGKDCPECEGTGVPLISPLEEQFNEAMELNGTRLHPDEDKFIEFEEDDYEI